jgi:hypothetical protein
MPSDVIDPPPGAPHPSGNEPESIRRPAEAGVNPPSEELAALPTEPPVLGSSSADDLSLSLAQPRPDPMLGELGSDAPPGGPALPDKPVAPPTAGLVPPDSASVVVPDLSSFKPGPVVSPPGSYDPETGVVLGPDAAAGGASVSSTDALASLGIGADLGPLFATSAGATGKAGQRTVAATDTEDEDDEEIAPRGPSWATVLLASYASAVTIGLVWVLWTGRKAKEVGEEAAPAAEVRPDPGVRADRSRKLVPSPPVAAEHLTILGRPVRLGAIEVTPVGVSSGRVVLERTLGRHEIKVGGRGALKLRLRLRNVSSDAVLAPLDEAFLRTPALGEPETYIEPARDGGMIRMFPLAVESEWSIDGQAFRELKPGESFEGLVVSAVGAVDQMAPEMTWRVRLRTDINHTEDLGVRFQSDEVRPER